MNIWIKKILDAGDLSKERVVLQANSDVDIGGYQIADTEALPEGVDSVIRRVFWFPDKEVKANDIVVLYTKVGTANEKRNESGNTSHFFYWGLDSAAWTHGRAAVLIKVVEWEAKKVD